MGITNLEAFLMAGILLNLTPGTDTVYILGRSLAQGKKAGVFSALGIATGALLHCIIAAFGLSVLLSKSPLAFIIIQYSGAAYLAYLGVKTLIFTSTFITVASEHSENANYTKIYGSGILTNLLNPKVALFFLAFIPQFIDPGVTDSSLPFLILGLTFVTTGTIWCLALAIFSGSLPRKIRQNQKINNWLEKGTGILFIILAINIVFMG